MLTGIEDGNPPVVITNVGRLDIPSTYGPLEIETISAAGAMHALLKTGLVILTFNRSMTINFVYSSPCISPENAEAMAQNFLQRLKAL